MGMRSNMGIRRICRAVAAILSATVIISYVGTFFSYADTLSASEKQQQIAEQQAEEQTVQAQRTKDRQAAQAKVDAQIKAESTVPGTVTGLKASTSTSTDGISAKALAKKKRYVTLSWDAAENADSYVVYYSYTKDGTYKATKSSVTETSKKNMLFPSTREVFFKVAAKNGENQSQLSESVVIWPGYGSEVNAMEIAFKSSSSVIYTGFSAVFKVNSSASMLKTYKIKWTSSNKSIAKVNQKGRVRAVANGTATITAKSHAGYTVSKEVTVKTVTPSVVPDVVGASPDDAKKAIEAAGFKAKLKKTFIREKDMKKKYPGVEMGQIMKQSQDAGSKLSRGSEVTLTYGDEIYYCGVGVEAMVKWAETVAADDSYGYSMGVYTGRGLDRLCPYTNTGASKDYDCATFVNAALAFSGMGQDFMNAAVKPSPVVRGVRDLMKKNGWKKVQVKRSYKSGGKTKTYYTKPGVKDLKRGDVLVNTSCHIQIHVGNGFDVGAHNNYDGKTGDSSGREVSVNYTWTGYAEVYRYYGNIGK